MTEKSKEKKEEHEAEERERLNHKEKKETKGKTETSREERMKKITELNLTSHYHQEGEQKAAWPFRCHDEGESQDNASVGS